MIKNQLNIVFSLIKTQLSMKNFKDYIIIPPQPVFVGGYTVRPSVRDILFPL